VNDISLAVWDVPMPVTAGENFGVKIGAKAGDGRALGGGVIEIIDSSGDVVASGMLGDAILPGTEALHWCDVSVPSPGADQHGDYSVRMNGAVATHFNVIATAKPEHSLRISIIEIVSAAPLAGVEIRLGPFRARTGADGHAEMKLSKGDYPLQLWLSSHLAPVPQPVITIDGDAALALHMTFVTEDHPDARWVR
jgi:hypothetical protein